MLLSRRRGLRAPRYPRGGLVTRREVLGGIGAALAAATAKSRVLTAGGQPLTVGGQSATQQPITWPRIALSFIGGHQNYSPRQSDLIAYLSHFDLAIIGADWEGAAAGNGWSRGSLVNSINAGDGTVSPHVSQYNICDHCVGPGGRGGAPSASKTPIWYEQINAMAPYWFLWESGHSGTHVITENNPYYWMSNPVDLGSQSKDRNGNALEAAFARYVRDYYFAGSTADAAPNLGGFFHDNFSSSSRVVGDWLQTGTAVAGRDASVYPSRFAGTAESVSWWRANMPGKLIGANVVSSGFMSDDESLRVYQRPNSLTGALTTTAKLDYHMQEGFIGERWATESWAGLSACAAIAAYSAGMTLHPEFNQNVTEQMDRNGECPGCTASAGQGMRYFCGAAWVLDNGCAGYMSQAYVPGGHYEMLDWFDWWSVNPATGECLNYAKSTQAQIGQYRKWLGTPIDPPQTAPDRSYGPLVFARRFHTSNGRIALILVNQSTNPGPNSAATVALPAGRWQALTASSSNYGANSSVDSGATGLTRVTIPTGDARILLQ